MNVYSQGGAPEFGLVRSHPWTESAEDAGARYYDFKEHPELIPTVIEDFRPWSQTRAVQGFYRLLAALNGHDSSLETNDCAFNEPAPNSSTAFAKRLHASGRLMILFRDLILNTRRDHVEWLERRLLESLSELDRGFPWTAVGTALAPTRFIHLPPSGQAGWQLAIHFFAWGDTEDETLDHFGRIVRCLAQALPALWTATPYNPPR